MNYPSIEQYKDSIRLSEHTLNFLKDYMPVFRSDGELWFSSGNFAVVFKLMNRTTGREIALKCFTRHQEGRKQNFQKIRECLNNYPSEYLVDYQYHDEELWVETGHEEGAEIPVLAMDWVNGLTLGDYVRQCCEKRDISSLKTLLEEFMWFSIWLLHQPFAHGDLNPDNIIIRPDGKPVLLDYDGMYVPEMQGQKAQELGSPVYRHPFRTEVYFSKRMDDYSLVILLLELRILTLAPDKYLNSGESLCLNTDDLKNPALPKLTRLATIGSDNADLGLTESLLNLFELASNGNDIGHQLDHALFRHFKGETSQIMKKTVIAPSSFIEPELVFVKGGTFEMGDIRNVIEYDDGTLHSVTVSDFYLSKTAVTFDEYDLFCDETKRNMPEDNDWGRKNRPIISVSWFDAIIYCNWLSEKAGLELAYVFNDGVVTFNRNSNGYRLPTESEWEYAARGGILSKGYKYAGSNFLREVGWYNDNSGNNTHPVKMKMANELGIYDMSGNVKEWCSDWYDDYPSGSQINPTGPNTGDYRVIRGGSFSYFPIGCRVWSRGNFEPDGRFRDLGFRLASSAPR
jgi:formylglycine-generating enzyme required for sulfatase activity